MDRMGRMFYCALEPKMQSEFVEVLAAHLVVRKSALDMAPVLGRVVHEFEVGEFVDNHIVYEGGFCHDDAPVEAYAAVRGAAAPTLALAADEDLRRLFAAHFGLPASDYFRQQAGGFAAIPAFHRFSAPGSTMLFRDVLRRSDVEGVAFEMDGYVVVWIPAKAGDVLWHGDVESVAFEMDGYACAWIPDPRLREDMLRGMTE